MVSNVNNKSIFDFDERLKFIGIDFNSKEKNIFNLNLKLHYGNHTINYKEQTININYETKDILATADDIRKYETLVLSSSSQELLLEFIEEARSSNANPERNDKLICRILKPGGMWGILSKIAKRSNKTLFLDIDLEELFKNAQEDPELFSKINIETLNLQLKNQFL